MVEWNSAQKQAIGLRDSNILVSAGAGSGKTAVLTARIVELLKEGADILEFAILTFSNAAAAEMKERISAGLKGEKSLRRQLELLPLASISTFHGFCKEIISENFESLNLPAKLHTLDAMLGITLREKAMESALEELYEEEKYRTFAKKISPKSDEVLKETILQVVELASCKPGGIDDLLAKNSSYLAGDVSEIKKTVIAFVEILLSHVKEEYAAFDHLLLIDFPKARAQRQQEEQDMEKILALLSAGRLEEILPLLKLERQASIRGNEEASTALKAVRGAAKDAFAQIKPMLQQLQEISREDFEDVFLLLQAAKVFEKNFAQLKLDNRVMDFSDMEKFALAILQDETVCDYYRQKYAYLFIDEYQDTSEMQETILQKIRRNNNLFMVGDIKQSIYRFRTADPTIFLEKYKTYTDSGQNRKIELNHNYRSKKNVLDFVNDIFSVLMNLRSKSYPQEVYLLGEEGEGAPVCVTELYEDGELSRAIGNEEREAAYIAGEIQKCHQAGTPYSDMAILLRKISGGLGAKYRKVLSHFGIPVYLVEDASSGENVELDIFLNLLQLVDNKQNDIPLLSVLYSPLYGFSLDELIAIRMQKEDTYYLNVTSYMQSHQDETSEKLQALFSQLSRWKEKSRELSIEQLLSIMLEETSYMGYLSTLPDANDKTSAVYQLLEFAKTFETQGHHGLYPFLEFLTAIREKGKSIQTTKVPISTDAVRIMTVHKSKGLEFPVVFVSGLNYKVIRKTVMSTTDVKTHRKLGVSLPHYNPKIGAKSATILGTAISIDDDFENMDEEFRLLYVAMTRAKEKLYLSGISKKREAYGAPLSTFTLMKENNMLKYLLHVLDYYPAKATVERKQVGLSTIEVLPQKQAERALVPKENESITKALARQQEYVPKEVMTKVSVSELAKKEPEIRIASDLKKETAAKRGTVTHAVLSLREKGESIEELLLRLEQNQYFTREELELIDRRMLERFYQSALLARIEASKKVFKEKPFVLVLTVQEDDVEKDTLVQGVIDLLFWESGGFVLVDYKTDYVKEDVEAEIARRYGQQLSLYAKAVENLTGYPVKEKLVYLLRTGREVIL